MLKQYGKLLLLCAFLMAGTFAVPALGHPQMPVPQDDVLQGEVLQGNVLNVAVLEDSPPYDFYNERNKLVGMNLDLMQEVGKRIHRPIKIQVTTYNRVVIGLLNHQVDVIAAPQSVSLYRSKVVRFCRPYLWSGDVLVSHPAGKRPQPGIHDLADLSSQHLQIGVFNGTSYPQFLQAQHLGGQMAIYPTQREMFLAFMNHKVPVMLMDEQIARYYAHQQGLPFQVSDKRVRDHKAMAFAVRKEDETLGGQIDRALAEMEADGTLHRIQKQWLQKQWPG